MSEKQVLAVLDLYVEEPVLGTESRFVREAGVLFGTPTVGPVADDELPPLTRRRPDLCDRRFTAVAFPFDLENLPGNGHYVEAMVRVTFEDPDVRAVMLASKSHGDAEVDTSGVGRRELTWRLVARDRKLGLRASGRTVLSIVESPLSAGPLIGTIDARVRFTRRLFGIESTSAAEPKRPQRFAIDVLRDSAFEFLDDQ